MLRIIKNLKVNKLNRGMSYIELIVVLGIFAAMSSIVLFNYGEFQAKVDIKNLASDIALKAVEAQKASLSGKLPPLALQVYIPVSWKPSYGVYFNRAVDSKSFVYFSDLNQNNVLDDTTCNFNTECLEKISITKGNYISAITVFYQSAAPVALSDATIIFSRPNSGAVITSSTSFTDVVSYIQITIASARAASVTSNIKLYLSGRVQVN